MLTGEHTKKLRVLRAEVIGAADGPALAVALNEFFEAGGEKDFIMAFRTAAFEVVVLFVE